MGIFRINYKYKNDSQKDFIFVHASNFAEAVKTVARKRPRPIPEYCILSVFQLQRWPQRHDKFMPFEESIKIQNELDEEKS